MADQAIDSGAPVDATAGLIDTQIASAQDTLGQNQADLLTARKQEQDYIAARDADVANYDPESAAGPQPTFTQPTPQDHFQDVMRVSPLLMALGAVGGAFTKQHGITMLASTNAMMKGVVQGNADAYAQARDNYEAQYKNFQDKSKTWLDVYKAYSTAYKGRIDADQKAVQGANAAVGIYERAGAVTKADIARMISLREALAKNNATALHQSKEDVVAQLRAENDRLKAEAAGKNADTNAHKEGRITANDKGKAGAGGDAAVQASETITQLKQLIDNNAFVTGAGGKARRLGEFVESSFNGDAKLPATQFAAKMKLLEAKAGELLKMKGRMGADQRKQITDAIDATKSATSGPQAKVQLDELARLLAVPPRKTINGVTYEQRDGKWYTSQ